MTRSGALPRLLAVGAVLLALAGCTAGRGQTPPAKADNAAETVPGKAPSPGDRCHQSTSEPATKVVLTAGDGTHLAGVEFGSGPRGVLLLPQRGADLCPWWPYATELLGRGFHVLAIDLRGTGYSEDGPTSDYTQDAQAGIAMLKQKGATKVVMVGASLGAAVALVTAGRAPGTVDGVVSLSSPDSSTDVTGNGGPDPHTPKQAASKITVPLLVCFTTGDPQAGPAADLKAPQAQLVGRPGVSHGWDMLKVGDDDVRPDVLAFLQADD